MPTTLTNGIQLPDKGSVDWYSSMQSNYNLIDTHLGDTDVHVTAEDKANWNSKQGSLSQDQLDAIAQVATNTSDIATLQSGKANASHTHSSSDITDIGDYATKQYVDNSISGLVDNAPDALNTLNELSAALNDDSNFASTVTTALAGKANSADLATVATSGSYNDLSNKPTINDSTITIQKNGSTVDTFTTNGSNKTINITVPTKTSDLTNDSNFVDTSNPAVSSGITSAKVTDYDSHIADTDIHVTTADKNRWNNNTYVFRYSSTALVASSTNSNTLLDSTDNLKVGDKVIDSSGVLFSVTAIDTANSTFTIGTALIDLAQDSDVVHKSGNETVGGIKTFSDNTYIKSLNFTKEIASPGSSSVIMPLITTVTYTDQTASESARINLAITTSGIKTLYPNENNLYSLGLPARKWSTVYGYMANLAGMYIGDEASANERTNLYLLANRDTDGQSGAYIGRFRQNRAQGTMSGGDVSFVSLDFLENSIRYTRCFTMGLTDWDSDGVPQTYYITAPNDKGSLGTSYQQWNKVYANEYYYGSANTEFSTKFVTTDTAQTITSNKTFVGSQYFKDNNVQYFGIDFSKGTAPSAYTARCTYFSPLTGGSSTYQSSNGLIGCAVNNDNVVTTFMHAIKNTAGATTRTSFVLYYDTDNDKRSVTTNGDFLPILSGQGIGNSTSKWSTINGLNPSSLSLPDLNNGIDISSYFDISLYTGQTYTPIANGWISISITSPNRGSLLCESVGISQTAYGVTDPDDNNKYRVSILVPCQASQTLTTYIRASGGTVNFAKFYPCQGNV